MASKRGSGGVIYTAESNGRRGLRFENPFTLKIGQVFTGFGVGCGVGIGVGHPLNLGGIPVLNEIMVATRGASDALSGVQRPLNNVLRKVGAKNIEAGIGCGVGFGHGFGVGLSVKPGVVHQIQSNLAEVAEKIMTKLGISPTSTISTQGLFHAPVQIDKNTVKETHHEGSMGGFIPQSVSNNSSQGKMRDEIVSEEPLANRYSSRVEGILNNFLKDPAFGSPLTEQAGTLQLEKSLLEMVLKHEVVIDKLKEENERLKQILGETFKLPPQKLVEKKILACNECFECRTRHRRRL